jgi:hypothetical protein
MRFSQAREIEKGSVREDATRFRGVGAVVPRVSLRRVNPFGLAHALDHVNPARAGRRQRIRPAASYQSLVYSFREVNQRWMS